MAHYLKLISMNCRGLRDIDKRRDVFNYLRQKDANIVCLQDTHLLTSETNSVRAQWGYECILSGSRRDARGVGVFFRNNFHYRMISYKCDQDGNLIIIKLEVNETVFAIVNMYGPNQDSPDFYRDVYREVRNMEADFIVMCADWNLVQDCTLDCKHYKTQNNKQASGAVLEMRDQLELLDPWRAKNPEGRRYTWTKRNPMKKARLDFFLMSRELMSCLDSVNILPGYRTDHSMVTLDIRLLTFNRGRGFWKFNNSLLRDEEYIRKVKQCISETRREYAVMIYDPRNLDRLSAETICFTIDDQMFLDILLMKVRMATISYTVHKKKRDRDRERDIEARLTHLQNVADQNDIHEETAEEEIMNLERELEKIRKEYMQGVMIRSKAKWAEEGERPTKYFCALEKRNYTNKCITRLKVERESKEVTEQKEILKHIQLFYQDLYSSREHELKCFDAGFIMNHTPPQIPEEMKAELNQSLEMGEIHRSLKNMKNNKSPGADGFTAEFFKFFWPDLKHYLHKSYLCSIEKGILSPTQRQGVITLLPKGNKPRELLKNWRPISLLNITYKVLSGSLAARLKNALHSIIGKEQRGFMKGRFIGDNTRLLYDVMKYVELKYQPGLLLLIDFEKAFDSLSWRFIEECLQYFGLGESFENYIRMLNRDSELCVIQCGHSSRFFPVQRGCRQGDPISPYLFLICVEIMAVRIREDSKVKGIRIGNREVKLFQYADDTGMLLDGSKSSILSALHLLEEFAKYSGLKPNIDKTQAIWLGSMRGCQENFSLSLEWTSRPFKVLGVIFSTSLHEMTTLNYEELRGEDEGSEL